MAIAARKGAFTAMGGGSVVIAVPSSAQNGDLMLAVIVTSSGINGTVTPPAGWTQIDAQLISGQGRLITYARTASSEPASYTWTISAGNIGGCIITFFDTNGASVAVAVDTFADGTGASSTSFSLPAFTPNAGSDPYELVVGIANQMAAATLTLPVTGYPLLSLNTIHSFAVVAYPVAKGTAAPTPSIGSSSTAQWLGQQIALKVTSASADRMMMVGFGANNTGSSVSSLSVNVPTNVANGDQLLMSIWSGDTSDNISLPAGWTQVAVQTATGGTLKLAKRTASSEPASYTVNLTSSSAINITLIAVRHMDGSSLDVDVYAINGGASLTASSEIGPTLIPNAAHELVACLWNAQQAGSAKVPTGVADGYFGDDSFLVSNPNPASYFAAQNTAITSARTLTTSTNTCVDCFGTQVAFAAVVSGTPVRPRPRAQTRAAGPAPDKPRHHKRADSGLAAAIAAILIPARRARRLSSPRRSPARNRKHRRFAAALIAALEAATNARVTRSSGEIVREGAAVNARVTRSSGEIVREGATVNARVTRSSGELVREGAVVTARLSRISIEIVRPNLVLPPRPDPLTELAVFVPNQDSRPFIVHRTVTSDRWDTLAWAYYGDAARVQPIIEANPSVAIAPVLEVGVQILIPVLTAETAPNPPPWKRTPQAPPATATKWLSHTTVEGDRWDLIAWKYYGDPTQLEPIVDANPGVPIAPVINAGTRLLIPQQTRTELQALAPGDLLPPWMRSTAQ